MNPRHDASALAFVLKSLAFAEGETVPTVHTCHGKDTSPPLEWSGAPEGTRFYAFIMDDPDAPRGTWTHWTWWDLPVTTIAIPQGADVTRLKAIQGTTSLRQMGYHGPCPPSGTHRYVFTLYALPHALMLPKGAHVNDLRAAVNGKSLGVATLTGRSSSK